MCRQSVKMKCSDPVVGQQAQAVFQELAVCGVWHFTGGHGELTVVIGAEPAGVTLDGNIKGGSVRTMSVREPCITLS